MKRLSPTSPATKRSTAATAKSPPAKPHPTRIDVIASLNPLTHHRLVARLMPPLLKIKPTPTIRPVDRPSRQHLRHLRHILLRISPPTRRIERTHRMILAHLALDAQ